MANTKNSGGQNQGGSGNQGGIMDNLNNVPDMLKKYSSTATRAVGNLSTTQKVIGGALLVLGAGYLSRKVGFMRSLGTIAATAMNKAGNLTGNMSKAGKNKHR